jgi:hypothetical protein
MLVITAFLTTIIVTIALTYPVYFSGEFAGHFRPFSRRSLPHMPHQQRLFESAGSLLRAGRRTTPTSQDVPMKMTAGTNTCANAEGTRSSHTSGKSLKETIAHLKPAFASSISLRRARTLRRSSTANTPRVP